MSSTKKQDQVETQGCFQNISTIVKGLLVIGGVLILLFFMLGLDKCGKTKTKIEGDVLIGSCKIDYSDSKTAIYDVLETVWELARDNEDCKKMKLKIILEGEDKYGKEKEFILGTLVVNNKDLKDIRKYEDKWSLIVSHVSVNVDVTRLFRDKGYRSY